MKHLSYYIYFTVVSFSSDANFFTYSCMKALFTSSLRNSSKVTLQMTMLGSYRFRQFACLNNTCISPFIISLLEFKLHLFYAKSYSYFN